MDGHGSTAHYLSLVWCASYVLPLCSGLFVFPLLFLQMKSSPSFKSGPCLLQASGKYIYEKMDCTRLLSKIGSVLIHMDGGELVSCCNAHSAVLQTLHNWVSEELAGRSSTAALLSTEGNQEERCKQVEPTPVAYHNTTSTQCPACSVPNHQPSRLWKQSLASLTHHLCSDCFAVTN